MPDEIWNEAARRYDEQALFALVLAIAVINVFNRLSVATRQVARRMVEIGRWTDAIGWPLNELVPSESGLSKWTSSR